MIRALPVCKGCGQPIRGSYITALGATWHPEHFVCAACSLPFTDTQFTIHEGAPYHIACYEQQIAPRCAYCGKPLREYLIDHWGTYFCKQHQYEYPTCVYCGRLVSPQQQEAAREPGEGIRCPICRASAVETVEVARPLFSQVKQWVGRQRLVYNNLPLSLDLCGPARLAALLHGRSQVHAHGATMSTTYTQDGRELYTKVEGVSVLRGLPAMLFQGVAVHELGHVWLVVHGVKNLPLWAEEGFCELLSYYWYSEVNTPESRYYSHSIEHRADPVYGEGFRRIYALANAVGFPRLVETLQTQKRLPELRS
jgi:hypothetical protein